MPVLKYFEEIVYMLEDVRDDLGIKGQFYNNENEILKTVQNPILMENK